MPGRRTGSSHPSKDDFAYWSALTERSKYIDTYTDVLKEADQRSISQVANFAKRIENFYQGILAGYIVAIIAIVSIFVISSILVLVESASDFQRTLGTFGLPTSLILLLILIYRTPLKSARQIVGEIIKMQVIYLGYLRQVNQIDIGFKQTLTTIEKMTPDQFQETFNQTQNIIDHALDDINILLEELG